MRPESVGSPDPTKVVSMLSPLAAIQLVEPVSVPTVRSTVVCCVNETRPKWVASPVPAVATTNAVSGPSMSVSLPCSVPLKGAFCCASEEQSQKAQGTVNFDRALGFNSPEFGDPAIDRF